MQVTELLRDLLFRQVGCTSSQPEISPGGPLPFLTVMHLNLLFFLFFFSFGAELVQLPNIRHLPDSEVRRGVEKLRDGRKKLGKRFQEGCPVSLGHLALFKIWTNDKTQLSHHVLRLIRSKNWCASSKYRKDPSSPHFLTLFQLLFGLFQKRRKAQSTKLCRNLKEGYLQKIVFLGCVFLSND